MNPTLPTKKVLHILGGKRTKAHDEYREFVIAHGDAGENAKVLRARWNAFQEAYQAIHAIVAE